MTPELRTAFAQLFVAPDRPCLIQGLRRVAGPDSPVSPDDALQLAAESLWRRPASLCTAWAQGGVPALRRLLFVAARRQIGRRRRVGAARYERCIYPPAEPYHTDTPERVLAQRRLARDLPALTRAAALTYGGGRADQLERALHDRVFSTDTETALAERYGVRREHLNRAHSWLRARLGC